MTEIEERSAQERPLGKGMLFGSLVGFILGLFLGWKFQMISMLCGLCSASGLVVGGFVVRTYHYWSGKLSWLVKSILKLFRKGG